MFEFRSFQSSYKSLSVARLLDNLKQLESGVWIQSEMQNTMHAQLNSIFIFFLGLSEIWDQSVSRQDIVDFFLCSALLELQ